MTNAYVIQIAGRTAGIVARDRADQSFHFFASCQTFVGLEGRAFAEPHQAERAARRIRMSANGPRKDSNNLKV
jgi:hypothetical protein